MLLASEAATGLAAGGMHNEFRNIELSLRPLNKAAKTLLLVATLGVVGAVVAEVLAYFAFELPETAVRTWVAAVVVGMAGLVATQVWLRGSKKYRPRRLAPFAALAGVNKGIGGGGYGPVVTLGGILSGVHEKSSVAVASAAEGIASTVGAIVFAVFVVLGEDVSWDLLPWLWLGAFPAAVLAPYVVRVLPGRIWRYVIPVYATVVAAVLLIDTYGTG